MTSDGTVKETETVDESPKGRLFIAERHADEPFIYCKENKIISNLNFALSFSAIKYDDAQPNEADVLVYFVNEEHEELCAIQEAHIVVGEITKVNFSLNASASSLSNCYLVIKSPKDAIREAQSISKFNIKIAFNVEFDF